MSTLVVQSLTTSLSQSFRLTHNKRYHIGAICPYLLMSGAPSGTFELKILQGSTELFSYSFNSQDIKDSLDTTDNYAHVFYPIVPTNPLFLERGDYILKLESTYSPSFANFIGWIQQHDNTQNDFEYIATSDNQLPLAFRMKILKQGVMP